MLKIFQAGINFEIKKATCVFTNNLSLQTTVRPSSNTYFSWSRAVPMAEPLKPKAALILQEFFSSENSLKPLTSLLLKATKACLCLLEDCIFYLSPLGLFSVNSWLNAISQEPSLYALLSFLIGCMRRIKRKRKLKAN